MMDVITDGEEWGSQLRMVGVTCWQLVGLPVCPLLGEVVEYIRTYVCTYIARVHMCV